ncbi:hypothetical protein [Fictibacillus sp. NRS-1165]|uniref:hypothetical protein n=1 Tax=Fictibacillus sp. NRS-1165 TaxID=3144463 RepID=UPI003D19E0E7
MEKMISEMLIKTAVASHEKRVPDFTFIREKENNQIHLIMDATETGKKWGHGRYLYHLKDSDSALYRTEFEVIEERGTRH